MPGPFPGMDPWLERPMLFPSLRDGLITYFQAALNAVLPKGYAATSANRVWVDVESRREPDVSVLGEGDRLADDRRGLAASTIVGAGLLEAGTDPLADPIEERYLEILADEGDRLVTAVEVLSLSNKKAGDGGRSSYQQKQGEYRASAVNLVEIDLLRSGPHTAAVPKPQIRAVATRYDYHLSVMLADVPNRYFVAPFMLSDRLPNVPVPLDPTVTPVTIDLQAVFDRCYDGGGYDRLARYDRRLPDPPLAAEQREWAEGILRAKGLLPAAKGG